MISIISNSIEDTKNIAGEWLASLHYDSSKSGSSLVKNLALLNKSTNKIATIIGLSGNLGSGKTTFTQYLAQKLGVTEFVTSPTFVIMKSYFTKHDFFKKLIHIDAYRFENPKELEVLNLENIIKDPSNLILIEWPEKVSKSLPEDLKIITFEVVDENKRKINFI